MQIFLGAAEQRAKLKSVFEPHVFQVSRCCRKEIYFNFFEMKSSFSAEEIVQVPKIEYEQVTKPWHWPRLPRLPLVCRKPCRLSFLPHSRN